MKTTTKRTAKKSMALIVTMLSIPAMIVIPFFVPPVLAVFVAAVFLYSTIWGIYVVIHK